MWWSGVCTCKSWSKCCTGMKRAQTPKYKVLYGFPVAWNHRALIFCNTVWIVYQSGGDDKPLCLATHCSWKPFCDCAPGYASGLPSTLGGWQGETFMLNCSHWLPWQRAVAKLRRGKERTLLHWIQLCMLEFLLHNQLNWAISYSAILSESHKANWGCKKDV